MFIVDRDIKYLIVVFSHFLVDTVSELTRVEWAIKLYYSSNSQTFSFGADLTWSGSRKLNE